jgi:hypothetical protein
MTGSKRKRLYNELRFEKMETQLTFPPRPSIFAESHSLADAMAG